MCIGHVCRHTQQAVPPDAKFVFHTHSNQCSFITQEIKQLITKRTVKTMAILGGFIVTPSHVSVGNQNICGNNTGAINKILEFES